MGVSNAAIPAKQTNINEPDQQVKWGRTSKARWYHNLGALLLVTAPVLLVHLNWIALQYFNGSLKTALVSMAEQGFVLFARQYFPQPSMSGFLGYAGWISLQALLCHYLPGKLCFGQRTPGGHLLSYNTNGVMAWAVTHLLFLVASVLGIIDPAIIAKSWAGLFVAANTYGFLMGICAQAKGYWAPSFPRDCKRTDSWIFDFWGGVGVGSHWLSSSRC
jgi:7-dehydrocholesterol reductase